MKIPLDLNRRFLTLTSFMQNQSITSSKTPPRSRLDRGLLFLLLTTVIFSFPNKPSFDLDASWRMALSQFFIDGLQFGRDVVFTYGPLGFVMGKTYSGNIYRKRAVRAVVGEQGFCKAFLKSAATVSASF